MRRFGGDDIPIGRPSSAAGRQGTESFRWGADAARGLSSDKYGPPPSRPAAFNRFGVAHPSKYGPPPDAGKYGFQPSRVGPLPSKYDRPMQNTRGFSPPRRGSIGNKEEYVKQVKALQRSVGKGAHSWDAFCDQTGGTRDPNRMSLEQLRIFCDALNRGIEPRIPSSMRRARSRSRGRGRGGGPGGDEGNGLVLKFRGLPFSCTVTDIQEFLAEYAVAEDFIVLGMKDGRATGEAYVSFPTREIAGEAMEAKHRKTIGTRWIEIFRCSEVEYDAERMGDQLAEFPENPTLRLRGLPFTATAHDVCDFLAEFGVQEMDVVIEKGGDGRNTGDAFVIFQDIETADRIERDMQRQRMGPRYIEFFKATLQEWTRASENALRASADRDGGPGGRGGRGGGGSFERLVHEIKQIQRQGDSERQRWWDFCASRGQSTYDPTRQTIDFLQDFVDLRNSGVSERARSRSPAKMCDFNGEFNEYGGFNDPGQFNNTPDLNLDGIDEGRVLKLRGLPFQCSQEDISQFFKEFFVLPEDCTIVSKNGRATGDGFTVFQDVEIANRAMRELQRKEIGSRYIELSVATRSEVSRTGGKGGVRRNGELSGDPLKDELIEKVKEIQRSSQEAKQKWRVWCDECGGGTYDPTRHNVDFLMEFANASMDGRL